CGQKNEACEHLFIVFQKNHWAPGTTRGFCLGLVRRHQRRLFKKGQLDVEGVIDREMPVAMAALGADKLKAADQVFLAYGFGWQQRKEFVNVPNRHIWAALKPVEQLDSRIGGDKKVDS